MQPKFGRPNLRPQRTHNKSQRVRRFLLEIPLKRARYYRIICVFLAFCITPVTIDAANAAVSLIANRSDVVFRVRSGDIVFAFERIGALENPGASDRFVWNLDLDALTALLQDEHGLDPREVSFAVLCGGLPREPEAVCHRVGTLRSGAEYHFTIVPTPSPPPASPTTQIINIIDSTCVVVGSRNRMTCR